MPGPRLTPLRTAQVTRAAGPWLDQVEPARSAGDWRQADATAAVYLFIDGDGRVCYCGQSARGLAGTCGRLREHLNDNIKRATFRAFHIVRLLDHTPPDVIDVIEGKVADSLGLRSELARRRWPSSSRWYELVDSPGARQAALGLGPPILGGTSAEP